MNLISCSCETGGMGSTDISNDSLAYIMGELVGEKIHNEYVNFMYHGESVNLSKVAEEFDRVCKLCSNKGFLEGLLVHNLSMQYGQMLYEQKEFEISTSKLRKYALNYLEDSTNFVSREDLPNQMALDDLIEKADTASIYEIFGGYIACSIARMMDEDSIIFAECKKEIYNGINYAENMYDRQPAIDGFCEYIAIQAVLGLSSMNIDGKFSPQISAKAFEKTILDGVVKSRTEKKQLLDNTLKEILKEFDEVDRSAILSIIE